MQQHRVEWSNATSIESILDLFSSTRINPSFEVVRVVFVRSSTLSTFASVQRKGFISVGCEAKPLVEAKAKPEVVTAGKNGNQPVFQFSCKSDSKIVERDESWKLFNFVLEFLMGENYRVVLFLENELY